ncbi:hypothetical protein J6590_094449 [Homalodisca vitripennis]|nr:hypothetical protein J6590_076140 [Homalodisca vitripennis]KAG8329118.1 hypothetical protein J6590_094449 [Homalodisca vitripennis]
MGRKLFLTGDLHHHTYYRANHNHLKTSQSSWLLNGRCLSHIKILIVLRSSILTPFSTERDRLKLLTLELLGRGRSSLLREIMLEWVGFVPYVTEVFASLNKGVSPPACFDWRGWFRAGLPFFRGEMILRLVP